MHCLFLLFMMNPFLHIFVPAVMVFLVYRMVMGRLRYARLRRTLDEEGTLLEQDWVLTRMRFPLIHRITFCLVVVTRRRFVLFHSITRGKVLQAPLGPAGATGKEGGRFDAESMGNKKVLSFYTALRGGGRIRMHVRDPMQWLALIRENAS
ncbi:MAG: hypothetical protein ABIK28_00430 [Planctomycetota bacterium]